ncbi:hypothetical protein SAMN04490248_13818 [Salinihabitans flavidus]|uniref:Uncharacterized protein n=1 Tax=Salinihabitans flavidus TaxID=569882 RepID=A0A1H8W044_9RHOB|nr:hypothetical protein [Salinihabitans flavidus]SEP20887.1 hypothetical protein SAMN04490248_13818 [Salinihabitans flavidus]
MTHAFSTLRQAVTTDPRWLPDRLREARAVIADVAHHSDHLIRLACKVLIRHGETERERRDAHVLLLIVEARTPQRHRPHRGPDDEPDPAEGAGVTS